MSPLFVLIILLGLISLCLRPTKKPVYYNSQEDQRYFERDYLGYYGMYRLQQDFMSGDNDEQT